MSDGKVHAMGLRPRRAHGPVRRRRGARWAFLSAVRPRHGVIGSAEMQRLAGLRISSKLVIVVGVAYALFVLWSPKEALSYGYVLIIYLVATMIWQRMNPEP